jgi:FKBP-type peptidyl-prolyl cis-trans isomerase
MFKLLTYSFLILFFASCNSNSINPEDIKRSEYKEPLIRVNNKLVKRDVDRVYGYAKRRNWNLKETETGLFYDIYYKTNFDSIKIGDEVSIKYKVNLLDGTLCYTSDSLGIRKFIVGKAQVETGLEQAVLMMKVGEKARLVLPPHLAFGLLGDEKKIPRRAIIVYEFEIVK